MPMTRPFFLAVAATVLIASTAAAATLSVHADDKRVTISNATPSRTVFLFGMTLSNERSLPTLRRFAEVVPADGSGAAVFEPPHGIPLRTIWFAVDAESGDSAVSGRSDGDVDAKPLVEHSFRKNSDALIEAIEDERISADLLLVRPKSGAWTLFAIEGGPADADHAGNGRLALPFADAKPLQPSYGEAPKHLKKGDVIAIIDPGQLEIFTATVEK